MGILGKELNNITNVIKNRALFNVELALVAFIAGQWFAEAVSNRSNVWWYPTYLLITVLVIKVIADAMANGEKKKK